MESVTELFYRNQIGISLARLVQIVVKLMNFMQFQSSQVLVHHFMTNLKIYDAISQGLILLKWNFMSHASFVLTQISFLSLLKNFFFFFII